MECTLSWLPNLCAWCMLSSKPTGRPSCLSRMFPGEDAPIKRWTSHSIRIQRQPVACGFCGTGGWKIRNPCTNRNSLATNMDFPWLARIGTNCSTGPGLWKLSFSHHFTHEPRLHSHAKTPCESQQAACQMAEWSTVPPHKAQSIDLTSLSFFWPEYWTVKFFRQISWASIGGRADWIAPVAVLRFWRSQ